MPVRIKSSRFTADAAVHTGQRRAERVDDVAIEAGASRVRGRNDMLPPLGIEMRAPGSLKAARRRVRKPVAAQVARVAESIARFGLVTPVLISRAGEIIDGHHVVEAAREAGLGEMPCIVVDHLGDEEIRALRITLNRLQERGEWDMDVLRLETIDLLDADIDMSVTGFSAQDLDIILLDDEGATRDKADALPDLTSAKTSTMGDIWLLGQHRLLCGDALDADNYRRLTGEDRASAMFTDPPYNIPIAGFVGGLGKHQHGDFAMGVGEMSDEQFKAFLNRFLANARAVMSDGAVAFVCIDWRGAGILVDAGCEAAFRHINTAVWNKGSGGMGGLYRSAHELIPVFVNGKTPATNNVELGRHGRDRTNVWTYPGANRQGSSAAALLADHPTPKPVELVADALLDVTRRGDIVIDPFSGSGTTLIAAEQSRRIARVIELDAGYVDLAVRRWEIFTGREAVHAETGETFAATVERRAREQAALDNATTSEDAVRPPEPG